MLGVAQRTAQIVENIRDGLPYRRQLFRLVQPLLHFHPDQSDGYGAGEQLHHLSFQRLNADV